MRVWTLKYMHLLWHQNYVDLWLGIDVKLLLPWPRIFMVTGLDLESHWPWPCTCSPRAHLYHVQELEGAGLWDEAEFNPCIDSELVSGRHYTNGCRTRVKQFSAVVVCNCRLVLVCIVVCKTSVTPIDFVAQLHRATELQCATVHVADCNFVAKTNWTNMASSDCDDDIFASSLVLVSLSQINSISSV